MSTNTAPLDTAPAPLDTAPAPLDTAPAPLDTALAVIWAHRANLRQPFIPAHDLYAQRGFWDISPVGKTLGPARISMVVESGSNADLGLPYGRDADVLDGIVTLGRELIAGRAHGRAAMVDVYERGDRIQATMLFKADSFLELIGRNRGASEYAEVQDSINRLFNAEVHREAASPLDYLDGRLIVEKGQIATWRTALDMYPEAGIERHGNNRPGSVLIVTPSKHVWRWIQNEGDVLRSISAEVYQRLGHGRPLFRWILGQLQHQEVRKRAYVEVRLDTLDDRLGLGYRARRSYPRDARRTILRMVEDIRVHTDLVPIAATISSRGWMSKVRVDIATRSDLLARPQPRAASSGAVASPTGVSSRPDVDFLTTVWRRPPSAKQVQLIDSKKLRPDQNLIAFEEAVARGKDPIRYLLEEYKLPSRPERNIADIVEPEPPCERCEGIARHNVNGQALCDECREAAA